MALIEVRTATLAQIDRGILGMALDLELAKAVADCRDRPAEKTAREITLNIKIKPCEPDLTGDVDSIDLTYSVKGKHPPRKSKTTNCGVQKNNRLVYADMAPDNHKQRTIDEITEGDQANGHA